MDREKRYQYVSSLLQQVDRVSLPIGSTSDQLELDAVFQPLTLRQDPLAAEDLAREKRRPLLGEGDDRNKRSGDQESASLEDERVTVPNVYEALGHSRNGRMVVLGGPGTGKTTVLKALVASACLDVLIRDTAPLPVFVALPDLARNGNPSLQDYLALDQSGLSSELASEVTENVASGNALVCLDSLDEVAPNLRPGVIEWIVRLAPRWGGQWVIGSRFTSYKGGELGTGSFTEWELTPLDDALRLEVARRLLPVLRDSLGKPSVDADDDAHALIATVSAHPETKAWGESPLLLSLAAVAYVKHGGLPVSRAALYGDVVQAVLMTREPDARRQADLARALGHIALTLFRRKGRTFTRGDLEIVVAALSTPVPQELTARAIDSGILEVVAHEVYAFRHQTLQEYLVATALADDLTSGDDRASTDAWELMWSKRTYSRWTEVLRLVVGVLVRRDGDSGTREARRWLGALAAQATSAAGDPGNLGLTLAVRSAAEVADAPPAWTDVEGIDIAAVLVRSWATRFLARESAGTYPLQRLAGEIRQLDPRAIVAGMDDVLVLLSQEDSHLRKKAVEALRWVADYLPVEPLVAYWKRLQVMPRDDNWSHENASALETIARTGRQAPVDLLLAAANPDEQGSYRPLLLCANAGNEESVTACQQLMRDDPDARVRHSLIACFAPSTVSKSLLELPLLGLNDRDATVRRLSASALHGLAQRFGTTIRDAIDPLLRGLHDSDGGVRAEAAHALGTMRVEEATGTLIAMLQDDFAAARQHAAQALGELKAAEAFSPLVNRLRSPGEAGTVLAYLTSALVKVDPVASVPYVISFLEADDAILPNAVSSACVALVSLGRLVPVADLIRLAANPNPRVRAAVAQTLGRFGDFAPREVLVKLVADDAIEVRRAAANACGLIGDPAMLPYLRLMLSDPDWDMRGKAAQALTRLGEPGAVVSVAEIVGDFSLCDNQTIAAALTIVGEMKGDAPLDFLSEALTQREPQIREAAVSALGTVGSKRAAILVASALRDNDPEVRRTAIFALSDFPAELLPIFDLVRLMCTDKDANVRFNATSALCRAGSDVPATDLVHALSNDVDARVRLSAATALGMLGKNAPFEALVTALADSHAKVRAAAAHSLRAFGDRVPVEKLFEAVQRAGPYYAEQEPFIEALGAASGLIPIERFLAAVEDRSCSWRPAAVGALGFYGDQAPVERLIEVLLEPGARPERPGVAQTAAASALLRLGNRVSSERLVTFLVSTNDFARAFASKALVALGERAPVVGIGELLQNKHPGIRHHVLCCLAQLGEHAPDEIFVAALDDPSEHVRERAATQIRTRHIAWALPQLEAAWQRATTDGFDVRVALAHARIALGGIDAVTGPKLADFLLRALVEADDETSEADSAAEALISLGDLMPAASLLPFLGSDNNDLFRLAARVLHETHPEALQEVFPEIFAIVRERRAGTTIGSRMRTAMAKAISRMQRVPPPLLDEVSNLLDWPFPPVRATAAYALGRIRRDIPDATIRKLLAMRSGSASVAADSALADILSLETGIEDD